MIYYCKLIIPRGFEPPDVQKRARPLMAAPVEIVIGSNILDGYGMISRYIFGGAGASLRQVTRQRQMDTITAYICRKRRFTVSSCAVLVYQQDRDSLWHGIGYS